MDKLKVLSFFLILTGAVTVYYWVDFYTAGGVRVLEEEWYVKFEEAFPPADMWMAANCFLGAAGLLKRRSWGLLFSLLAASSLVFLALMDITFNLENGLYRLAATSPEMAFEVVINVYTITLGILTPVIVWRKREELLGDREN